MVSTHLILALFLPRLLDVQYMVRICSEPYLRKPFCIFLNMPIVLKALKDLGSAYFRIDWIGNVVSRSLKAAATPSVNVVVSIRSSLHDTRVGEGFTQVELTIPVAYLRLLRIGDMWQYGRRVNGGDGEQLSFSNVEINSETVDVKPVGLPVAVDDEICFLLPFDQYCSHRRHTGAYAARVRIDEKTFILIPCMELIRFYFGSSGALLARLFSGPISGHDLYESAKTNLMGVAHVRLSPGIPGIAAATVARIALDRHAASAANWIVKSGVSAAANGAPHYPATKFPFVGRTTLSAVGRWVKASGYDVFVVDRLLSCTYPFPFRSLFYELHPSEKRSNSKGMVSPSSAQPRRHATSNTGDGELNEGAVKSTWATATINFEEGLEAFPDLSGKLIRRKMSNPVVASVGSTKNPLLAVGPRETSGPYRNVDISAAPEQSMENSKSGQIAILEAIGVLRSNHAIDACLAPLPGLLPITVEPFKQIKYVGPLAQHKYPIMAGVQLSVGNGDQPREFLLLTYESPSCEQNEPAAIIVGMPDVLRRRSEQCWSLFSLWIMARHFAGICPIDDADSIGVNHLISAKEADNPQLLAEVLLSIICDKN
ncbi:hypothetical protein Undi14_01375 [Undibacterium sp. 14-3-2]|uniref:hypothetical protein n=1 Tax=Undibacterium sp. 14-3-2 TaxID=2800129 RepID=UPI0019053FF2|nr:hypothetical protein [Undibacterium sp. 14-3-2]MBK1888667.1 hypothetical protein [Undibacterium sp. 14-3-2]